MKTPNRLQVLIDEGLVDGVLRQLESGEEAEMFVMRCGAETRAAKVYKAATQRSFRQAVDYTESRKVKNSRQARAQTLPLLRRRVAPGAGGRRRRTCSPTAERCAVHARPQGMAAGLGLAGPLPTEWNHQVLGP
jgi:hypothetical protein